MKAALLKKKIHYRSPRVRNSPTKGTTDYLVTSSSAPGPTIFDRTLTWPLVALTPCWVSPNAITIFRFICVPFVMFFLWAARYDLGLIIFAFAAISDMLDGALARTRRQITDWGKLFDPLADKLLIGGAAVIIVSRMISFWLVICLVGIEAALILYNIFFRGRRAKVIHARLEGKIKMVLQCLGVGLVIIYALAPEQAWLASLAAVILWAAVGFGALSLFVYKTI